MCPWHLCDSVCEIRGVAQPGRVLRSGRRSRRFESSHPDQVSGVLIGGGPHQAWRRMIFSAPAFLPLSISPCRFRLRKPPGTGTRPARLQSPPAVCPPFWICTLFRMFRNILRRCRHKRSGDVLISKILLIALIVIALLLLMRGMRRRTPPPESPPNAEAMVCCAHCGLHLPRAESVISSGRHFCCEQHRRDAG